MTAIERILEAFSNFWNAFLDAIPQMLVGLVLVIVFALVSAGIGRLFEQRMARRSGDKIVIRFVVRLIRAVLVLVGIVLAMGVMGFKGVAGGLLAGAGIGAVVIGFAFKEIGENFLAGIILVFDRSFEMGDTVTINNITGKVQGLQFRSTHLKAFDGRDVYVPNGAVLRNDMYNHTRDGLARQEFTIPLEYKADVQTAVALIVKHINAHPEVLEDEKTQVLVHEFTTSGMVLKVMFWLHTFDYKVGALEVRSQLMNEVKEALAAAGYGFPSPVQEVLLGYKEQPVESTLRRGE